MRFGLPSNFEIEGQSVSPETRAMEYPSSELQHSYSVARLKNDTSFTSLHISKPINIVLDNTNESTKRLFQHEEDIRKQTVKKLEGDLAENRAKLKSNLDYITRKIEQLMMDQNQDVKRMISKEKKAIQERIERERELERQKQEAEQRRKEEERKLKEKEENDRRRAVEQEKLKQRELEKQKEMEEESRRREKELTEKRSAGFTNFDAVEREFFKFKHDIKSIKENVVGGLNSNPAMRKNVNQLKRKLNPKFGQLSNSMQQLKKINDEVIELIEYSMSVDELAYKWILNFVAKAIVAQAETEVIVQPSAALPLARIAYSLLNRFQDFSYFLISRFVKKCPFIIGFTCKIDSEEGRTKMGWKRREEKWEDEVKYDERIAGICSVWSTMTKLTDFPQVAYFSIEDSWKFLARHLNTNHSLITNAHFSVIANWWEACGRDFLIKYRNQGTKMLQAVAFDFTSSCSDKRYPAAARLNILGEEWVQTNNIASLKEMEN